jgi:hypothetical protein
MKESWLFTDHLLIERQCKYQTRRQLFEGQALTYTIGQDDQSGRMLWMLVCGKDRDLCPQSLVSSGWDYSRGGMRFDPNAPAKRLCISPAIAISRHC